MITITIDYDEIGPRCRIETAPGDPPLRLELPDGGMPAERPLAETQPAQPDRQGNGEGAARRQRRQIWAGWPVQLLVMAGVLVLTLQAGSLLGGLRDVSGERPLASPPSSPSAKRAPRLPVPDADDAPAGRHEAGGLASSFPAGASAGPDLRAVTREFDTDLAGRPRVIVPEPAKVRATAGNDTDAGLAPPHTGVSRPDASDLSLFGLKP